MELMATRRTRPVSVLLSLLLFSIIYQSGTVQAANNPDDLLFKVTRILILLIPAIILFLSSLKIDRAFIEKAFFIILLTETLAIVNYSLFPDSAGTLQYKILAFILFFATAYVSERSRVNAESLMYKIILCIAAVTLFFYLLAELIHIPLPYTIFQKGESFTYKNYFNLFYSYSTSRIPRLSGLFWEPGVYQIYLNLALFLYYKQKRKNRFQLAVLLANLLFVQSTSGYMIATLMIIAILIDQKKTSVSTKRLIEMIGVVVALICILIVFTTKKNATNVAGDSYFDRLLQAKTGLQLFSQKPFFGWGFYNTAQYGTILETGSGNSNGLLTWMYSTGIVGMIFAFFPFLINVKKGKKHRDRLTGWIWLVFFVIENMTEPIYALSITIFWMANEYYRALTKRKQEMRITDLWDQLVDLAGQKRRLNICICYHPEKKDQHLPEGHK